MSSFKERLQQLVQKQEQQTATNALQESLKIARGKEVYNQIEKLASYFNQSLKPILEQINEVYLHEKGQVKITDSNHNYEEPDYSHPFVALTLEWNRTFDSGNRIELATTTDWSVFVSGAGNTIEPKRINLRFRGSESKIQNALIKLLEDPRATAWKETPDHSGDTR